MRYDNKKARLLALAVGVLLPILLISAIAAATPRITFTNAKDTNITFTVKKTVQSSTADALPDTIADDEFNFKLLLGSNAASGVKYYLYDAEGAEWVQYYTVSDSSISYVECKRSELSEDNQNAVVPFTTGENGEFTLKSGWYAVFYGTNLRVNTAYTVTEVTDTDGKCVLTTDDNKTYYYKPTLASQSGTIIDGVNSEEFVNTYYPPEEKSSVCNLQITKNIITKAGYDSAGGGTFKYKIVLDGENYANKPYKVYSIGGTTIVSQGTTDDKGVMQLDGGQYAVFENVPTDTEYYVYEYQNGSWWSVGGTSGKATVNGETVSYADFRNHSTTAPTTNVEFTNRRASFIVKKTIAGGKTDELGTDFTFELDDASGNPWVHRPYYLYSVNGTLIGKNIDSSAMLFYTDDVGRFTLKANQAAMFIGMSEGTKYTVKEVENPLYRLVTPAKADAYENKSVLSGIEELPFSNEVLEQVGLFVRKTVNDSTSSKNSTRDYTFTLLNSSGIAVTNAVYVKSDNKSYTTGKNGQFTLKDGEYAHFTKLDAGKYKVMETYTNEKNLKISAKLNSDDLEMTGKDNNYTDEFSVTADDVTSLEMINTYGDYRFRIVKHYTGSEQQRFLFKIERYENSVLKETFYTELNVADGESSVDVTAPEGGWYKVTEVAEYSNGGKTFTDTSWYQQGSNGEAIKTNTTNIEIGTNQPYVYFNLTELYDVDSLPEAHFENEERSYNYISSPAYAENHTQKIDGAIQS